MLSAGADKDGLRKRREPSLDLTISMFREDLEHFVSGAEIQGAVGQNTVNVQDQQTDAGGTLPDVGRVILNHSFLV